MFDTSKLTAYVEQHKGDILTKSLFSGVTADNVTVQPGVKGPTSINLLDVAVNFADGSACGFEASGNDELSQRIITPAIVKVNKEWCDKTLKGFYAQSEIKYGATNKELPLEEVLMDALAGGVSEGVEKALWNGTGLVSGTEGLANIILADTKSANAVTITTQSRLKALQDAYVKLPEGVIGKSDLKGYIAPAYFEGLVMDLVNANLYHVNPNDEDGVITMPGTNVKLVRCPGLAGNTANIDAVFARESNLVYGVDAASDATDMDVWYSKDDRTWKAVVEFVIGTQVAFPDEITYVKH